MLPPVELEVDEVLALLELDAGGRRSRSLALSLIHIEMCIRDSSRAHKSACGNIVNNNCRIICTCVVFRQKLP